MKVYTLYEQLGVFDNTKLGIYKTKELAAKVASKLAKTKSWPKISIICWGLMDDYGLEEGVYILEEVVYTSEIHNKKED